MADDDDDNDGVPDIYEDKDGNQMLDYLEAKDTDGDGIPDYLDEDDDNDGIPDHLDDDDDNDGIPDDEEDENMNSVPDVMEMKDSDGDGIIDLLDTDDDNDGIPDYLDDDDDGDGIPDDKEDSDGDGIPDKQEKTRPPRKIPPPPTRTEKGPAKKRSAPDSDNDDEVKSVFGKAPKPKKKAPAYSDESEESSKPSVLRQVVQSVLRRMEAIFGVDE
ncbi:Thrombospondin-3b [Taenia solium]|eukprot:TsM_000054800 transcript=TsM_000054800 gene=TsM_000054800